MGIFLKKNIYQKKIKESCNVGVLKKSLCVILYVM
jgi:hypothetical protein